MRSPARKVTITLIAGAAALVATGCGTTPSETGASATAAPVAGTASSSATPKPYVELKADPNDQACIRFAENHNVLANLMIDGKGDLTVEEWQQSELDMVSALDSASLTAEGEIAARMKAAVLLIPADPRDMVGTVEWRIGEEYNQAISRVHTACEADGIAYAMKAIPLAPEIFRR